MANEYKILRNSEEYGPYDREMIKSMAQSGALFQTDLLSKDSGPWVKVSTLGNLLASESSSSSWPAIQNLPDASTKSNVAEDFAPSPTRQEPPIPSQRIAQTRRPPSPEKKPPPIPNTIQQGEFPEPPPISKQKSNGSRLFIWMAITLIIGGTTIAGWVFYTDIQSLILKFKTTDSLANSDDPIAKAWQLSVMEKETAKDSAPKMELEKSIDINTEALPAFTEKMNTYFTKTKKIGISEDGSTTKDFKAEKTKFITIHTGAITASTISTERGFLISMLKRNSRQKSTQSSPMRAKKEVAYEASSETPQKSEDPPLFSMEFEINIKTKISISNIAAAYRLEGIDSAGSVIANGKVDCSKVIPSNTEVVVTGLLMFDSREEIPKVANIRLAKNIDPDTANFETNLVNALSNGDIRTSRELGLYKKPEWDQIFMTHCTDSLEKPKSITRIAAATAYAAHRTKNQNESSLVTKIANDKDPEVAFVILSTLADMESPSVNLVEKLISAASSTTTENRGKYLEVLRKLKPNTAGMLDLLIRETKNREPSIKATAADLVAMATIPADKAIPIAISLMGEKDPAVQISGMRILGSHTSLNRTECISKLLLLTGSSELKVKSMAGTTLDQYKPLKTTDIPVIRDNLSNQNPEIRLKSCVLASNFGEDGIPLLPALLTLTEDPTKELQLASITAIGKMGRVASSAAPKLITFTKSSTPAIKIESMRTLASISREQAVVEILFDGLSDSNPEISEAAEAGIKSLRPPLGSVDLMQIGKRTNDPSAKVRKVVFTALERMKGEGKPIAENVEKGLNDPDPEIILLAIKSLTSYPMERPGTIQKIGSILSDNCSNASKSETTIACLNFLSSVKGKKSASEIPAIRKTIASNSSKAIISAALEAIKATGEEGQQLAPDLLKFITRPDESQNPDNIRAYVNSFMMAGLNAQLRETLVAMGSPGAIELGKGLFNPDAAVRLFCLACLEQMGANAKPAMSSIYRITVQQNEKYIIVLQYARYTYGVLEKINKAK